MSLIAISVELPRFDEGHRIQRAPSSFDLSQSQAAQQLGVSRPSISEMEAGRRNISATELLSLADLYGVRTDWLSGQEASSLEHPDLELVARKIAGLKNEDVEHLIDLLTSIVSQRK